MCFPNPESWHSNPTQALSGAKALSEKVMLGMLLIWLGHSMVPKIGAASNATVQQPEITAKTLEMQLAQSIRSIWSLLPEGFPGLISLLPLHPRFLGQSRIAAPKVKVRLGA